jgi:hypothetical protein
MLGHFVHLASQGIVDLRCRLTLLFLRQCILLLQIHEVLFKEKGLKPADIQQFSKTASGRYRISKALLQVSKAHSLQSTLP